MPDAMVYRELQFRKVPFSYRWFDPQWSPQLKAIIPDYHPEFTLPQYKIVIIVLGSFWGTLPGIIDRNALAKAVLESEGWKFAIWNEVDIRRNVGQLFTKELPELNQPRIKGHVIPSPYGIPTYLLEFRKRAGLGRNPIKKSRGTRRRVGRKRYSNRRHYPQRRRSR